MTILMVEIFKTNVTEENHAAAIISLLRQHLPACVVNFDLKDCDNILRVKGENFCVTQIIELLRQFGFTCSLLD
jgi:hypothetical protein